MAYSRRMRRIVLLVRGGFAASALALSTAPALADCNSGNVGKSDLLTSINCQANAAYPLATAVGYDAWAGHAGTAYGHGARAKGLKSTVVGILAGYDYAVEGATIFGAYAGYNGAGVYSTAIGAGDTHGTGAAALGDHSIAIGGGNGDAFPGARSLGYRSIAIGQKSVSANFGTSVGFNTNTAFASTAIGTDALASADSTTAVGRFSKANAAFGSALGTDARAEGIKSIALGYQSRATAANTAALGWGAQATGVNAVAIGRGSLANAGNTVSVGNTSLKRRIVNVAPGVSATDAVNVAQLKAAVAAVARASAATEPAPAAPEQPAISVRPAGTDRARSDDDQIRRRLSELEALVERLQQRIAQLEGRAVAAGR